MTAIAAAAQPEQQRALADLLDFSAFERVEGGVDRLRDLIVELAISGRLETNDLSETPAARLVELARPKLAKEKHRSVVGLDPQPFPLPPNWTWSQAQELGVVSPRNEAPDSKRVGFVPMNVVPVDYRQPVAPGVRSWGDIRRGYTHLADGDVAVAKITPCFQNKKSCVLEGLPGGIGAGTTELHVVRPLPGVVEPKFLLLFLKSPLFISAGVPRMTGTAGQKRISVEYFAAAPLPLPPLAEQKRIVAKVDQLMALCDELEAKQTKKREVGDRLTQAALAALISADTPEEFKAAWKRVRENFGSLIDAPSLLPGLREALLNLALKGLLVDQEASDGTADQLVDRLPAKKAALSKRLGLRSDGTQSSAVTEEEQPHRIPSSWRWVRLSALGCFMGGGTPSKANPAYWSGPIPWVSPKDMKRPFISDAEDHISQAAIDSSAAKLIPSPSLLMVLRGMILAHSFPVALTDRDVAVNQDMRALVFSDPHLAPFALRACQAARRRVLSRVERSSHGTCRLDSTVAESLPIALPPLAEQERIIKRLDELIAACNELEAKLRARDGTAERLAEALVASATGSDPASAS